MGRRRVKQVTADSGMMNYVWSCIHDGLIPQPLKTAIKLRPIPPRRDRTGVVVDKHVSPRLATGPNPPTADPRTASARQKSSPGRMPSLALGPAGDLGCACGGPRRRGTRGRLAPAGCGSRRFPARSVEPQTHGEGRSLPCGGGAVASRPARYTPDVAAAQTLVPGLVRGWAGGARC